MLARMRPIDLSHGADPDAPRRPPVLFRWTIRGLVALCGLLMLMVLLSEPRVAERVEAVLEEVQTLLDAPAAPAGNATAAVDTSLRISVDSADEDQPARPVVRMMPQDRVPVRRAGN